MGEVRFVARAPAGGLARWVESVWAFEGVQAHAGDWVLPSAKMQLLFNLEARPEGMAPTLVCGLRDRPVWVEAAAMRRIAGAVLTPVGAGAFMRVPVEETLGLDVDLADLWGRTLASVARERMLEAAWASAGLGGVLDGVEAVLREAVRPDFSPPDYLRGAVRALAGGTRVAEVIERGGVARSRLRRDFERYVGGAPKLTASLHRFRRALVRLSTSVEDGATSSLAEIALDCGYVDQAHMSHELRRFSGMTPAAYARLALRFPGHVAG